jgi:DNA-binding NarL/FixJ family response regulator
METVDVIDVLVVDGHVMVAKGLAMLLDTDSAINIVGTASSVRDAVERCKRCSPDVVVMDIAFPDSDAASAISAIRATAPNTKVVMVTGSTSDDALALAVDADCAGYVSKSADIDELVGAIQSVADGRAYFSPVALARLLHSRRSPAAGSHSVSEREREVLQLLADGRTVTDIAVCLRLSTHTVRNHIRRAMKHLGVHSRLDAVVAAARAGILSVDPSRPQRAIAR